jgi:hypothetical protein
VRADLEDVERRRIEEKERDKDYGKKEREEVHEINNRISQEEQQRKAVSILKGTTISYTCVYNRR